MELYRIQNVSKNFFNGAHEVAALAEINLSFMQGEFTALVGPSGSGKTTLLNLMGCLDKPTEGALYFQGKDITRLTARQLALKRLRQIGFIFQDYNLIPTLSALENVEYVLWLQGVSPRERRARAAAVLERVGLGNLVNRRPNALSRGQQQRVAISRAIVHRPRIVLGDELTANLDHKTGVDLMNFLKDLNRSEKMTFVYATHDPVMMKFADRIVRLHDGKIADEPKV